MRKIFFGLLMGAAVMPSVLFAVNIQCSTKVSFVGADKTSMTVQAQHFDTKSFKGMFNSSTASYDRLVKDMGSVVIGANGAELVVLENVGDKVDVRYYKIGGSQAEQGIMLYTRGIGEKAQEKSYPNSRFDHVQAICKKL